MASLHIWIRATLDWEDEEAFEAQLSEKGRARVAVWNRNLSPPFHLFRARVKAIAQANLAAVEGAVVSDWERIPEGARVVPIDDDDWLAPGLAIELGRAWPELAEGVHWSPRFVGVASHRRHLLYTLRRELFRNSAAFMTCDTNNYALIKRAGRESIFEHHPTASRWFDGEGAGLVTRIPGQLSVNNRTLASLTSLRPPPGAEQLSRERLLRRLRRYRQIYARRRWWRDPPWATPYTEAMAELMGEVEPLPP